jgi:fibronectin-binding autotransporter adhesin
MRSKRKSVICSSAALVAGIMLSRVVQANVNPVTVISNEVNGPVGSGDSYFTNPPTNTTTASTGLGIPWYNATANDPGNVTNGPATNNVGWQVPGGGTISHTPYSMSGAIGSVGSPAIGATDGVSSMKVTTPGAGSGFDSTGDVLGSEYSVNSSYTAFMQAFVGSNLIEADITLPVAPVYVGGGSTSNDALAVYFRLTYKDEGGGSVDAAGGYSGYRTTTNRALSTVSFASNSVANGGGETGTKTMIWNYGELAGLDNQDAGALGLDDNGSSFYARLDLDSASKNPITYYIDNIRFASRQVTYIGGASGSISTSANWSGLDTDPSNSYYAPGTNQDQTTTNPLYLANHVIINDCLHFAGAGVHAINNDEGSFSPDGDGAYSLTSNSQYGGLVFDSGAGAFTISGQAIDIAGDIDNNSTSVQTISTLAGGIGLRLMNPINLNSIAGGALVVTTPITSYPNANTGTLQGTQFGITVGGAGLVKLTGANTYKGATTVNGGVLEFGDVTSYNGSSNTSNPGTVLIVINPNSAAGVDTGSLAATFLAKIANAYASGWTGTVPATQGDVGTGALALATADAAVNIDFTGTVGGAANLSASGLSGLSIGALPSGVAYTGTITPPTTGGFANTFRLGGGGVLTVQNALTGASNKAEITNLGTVVLNGTNTYGGNTAIDAGSTLNIGATGSIVSPNISVGTGSTMTVAAGGSILSGTNLSNNGTVNFNANRVLGSLNGATGSSVNLAGPAALTVNGGGTYAGNITGTGSLTVGGSTLELDGPTNSYNGNTTVNGGATLNVGNATLAGSLPSTTVLTSNGTTKFAANPGTGILSRTVAGITLSTGGKVTVSGPTSGTHANRTLLTTSNLTFGGATNGWQGSLNLTGNDLLIHGGIIANVTNQLKQGRVGNWTGANGIVSSAAAADTRFLTTLGSRPGAAGPTGVTLDGVNTTSADVLVKYTYYGDADLSGKIDGADYALIDTGFHTPGASGWVNGDFNYDGVIDGTDYSLIDNTFNQYFATGASPLALIAGSASSIATSAVPEPTTLALLGIGAFGLMGRRRTKKNVVSAR